MPNDARPTPVPVVRVITRLNIGGPSIQATRLTSALERRPIARVHHRVALVEQTADDTRLPASVRGGIGAFELSVEGVELSLSLGHRRPVAEPSNGAERLVRGFFGFRETSPPSFPHGTMTNEGAFP